MNIIHTWKQLGFDSEEMISIDGCTWETLSPRISELVANATAWNTYQSGSEYAIEFVTGDLDDVYKTRIVGTAREMIPFRRILELFLEVKDDWRKNPMELFLSICTYVVNKTRVVTTTELTPHPRKWDDLQGDMLPILTGKKAWGH